MSALRRSPASSVLRLAKSSGIVGRSWRTAAVSWAGALVALLSTTLLTKGLGTAGYGAYAFALAWATLLPVPATASSQRLLLREVASDIGSANWERLHGIIRWSTGYGLRIAVATAVAAFLVGLVAVHGSLRDPFLLGTALVPVFALVAIQAGILQGAARTATGAFPDALLRPVILMLLVGAIYLLRGVELRSEEAVALLLVSSLVALAYGRVAIKRALPAAVWNAEPVTDRAGEWRRMSLPFMALGLIWYGNNYVPQIVLGAVSTPVQIGLYAVAARLSLVLVMFLAAVNTALSPNFARLAKQGAAGQLQDIATRGARLGFGFALLSGVAMIAAADPLLGIFGAGFTDARPALVILAAGQVVNASTGPAAMLLMMSGHERLATKGVAVGLAANVALTLALAPGLGATGGAIGATASLVIWNGLMTIAARNQLRVNTTVFARRRIDESGDLA